MELDLLKIHLGYLKDLLIAKSGSIPILASLSAGVLVIATLNPDLVSIGTNMKIAVTILLALIPISLLFYSWDGLCPVFVSQGNVAGISRGVQFPGCVFLHFTCEDHNPCCEGLIRYQEVS